MTSERNDPPLNGASAAKPDEKPADTPASKPLGTTLEPTSAASTPRSDAKTDTVKSESKPASSAASMAASKPASPPPPPRPTGPARGGMGFVGVLLLALIVSAIVAGALIYFAPRWTPMMGARQVATSSAPAADPRVAELQARVEQLSARPAADPAQGENLRGQIGKLQEDLARLAKEQQATTDTLAQVAGEIDDIKPGEATAANEALQQRLVRMEQQMADAAAALERLRAMRGELDAAVAQLTKLAQAEQRLGALEKDAAERRGVDSKATEAARAAAIVSLGTRVRQAVASGQDGTADLTALKGLAGQDNELLEPITALTGKKLSTPETLRQSFPAVARQIIAADATDQAGEWWEKALARLQSLVSIRRTGPDVAGDDAEARVAQAEVALRANRLDQAVAALKQLTGQAAKEAAPWIAEAEAVLAAQAAADRIVARGAVLLGQTAGAQSNPR